MYPYGQGYARPGAPPGMPPGMAAPYGMGVPGVAVPGAPPGFGMPPGAAPPGGPPGMIPPPGIGAPGTGAPPGTSQANMPQRGGIAGFAPPANLPNINFNAPIIRLGTSVTRQNPLPTPNTGPSKGQGANVGQVNELQPPTGEEMLKTVFVGSIPSGISDEWMERILRAAATLKKWTRATDEAGKPCKFGFAEYEDPQSLGCAIEVLKDLEIPPVDDRTEGSKLCVTIDDKSRTYLENVEDANGDHLEFRIDTARGDLERTLAEFKDPAKHSGARDSESEHPSETPKPDGADTSIQPEIVEIPLSADDELSDIPADMRDMVAKEIAAFRERSNRRDMERMKREEEIEKMERERNNPQTPRINRLASPPPPAPTGLNGGSNSIPLGPSRLREGPQPGQRIPTGPSAGVQIPRDYQKGVSFVNGYSTSYYTREEEEADISDSELDRRRKAKKQQDQEKSFQDHERRWLNRERARTSAIERERQRDEDDIRREAADRAAMAKRLAEWDDDVETEKNTEDYYRDRSLWIRTRSTFRQRELDHDERDRQQEARQAELDGDKKRVAESMADSFLAQQAAEMEKAAVEKQEPARFKLALGAAASRRQAEAPKRKTAADVENLLEDEEDDDQKTKRVLIPIQYNVGSSMDDETRDRLVRQLAQEIPSDSKGLFAWKVLWDQVDEAIIKEKLQPFVEKKIVEYLGVQEQDLIDFVLKHIRQHGEPEELVKELEMTLDEDAETMVRKVWRMLIFYSESEKRGLN